MDDKPSAFVDSPEDLMRKARIVINSGKADPDVAILLTDLGRELAKSREGHATRMRMVADNASEMNALRDEVKLLRVSDNVSEMNALRDEVKQLRKYRVLAWALVGVLAVDVVLAILTSLHR